MMNAPTSPIPVPAPVFSIRRPIVVAVSVSVSVFTMGAAGNTTGVLGVFVNNLSREILVPSLSEPVTKAPRATKGKTSQTSRGNIKGETGRGAAEEGGWPTAWWLVAPPAMAATIPATIGTDPVLRRLNAAM